MAWPQHHLTRFTSSFHFMKVTRIAFLHTYFASKMCWFFLIPLCNYIQKIITSPIKILFSLLLKILLWLLKGRPVMIFSFTLYHQPFQVIWNALQVTLKTMDTWLNSHGMIPLHLIWMRTPLLNTAIAWLKVCYSQKSLKSKILIYN